MPYGDPIAPRGWHPSADRRSDIRRRISAMPSILVVEDHPLFVQSLVRLLRDRGGYKVSSVASAEEALQQLKDGSRFDLVMIDVSLPGMSGIDLIEEIHGKTP